MDVERGKRQRPPGDLALGRLGHDAGVDQAHVAGGAAHVEAEHVALATGLAEQARPGDTTSRPGQDGQRRVRSRSGGVGEPAGGLHHLHLGQSSSRTVAPKAVEIVGEQRRERGVDLGRARPLVLAKGANELVGECHVDSRQRLGDQLAQPALVLGVGVGVQQHDGDGPRPGGGQLFDELSRPRMLQRLQHALGRTALGRPETQLGWREWRGPPLAQPVQAGARLPAQLDNVGEALGGDERRARADALQQRVGRDGHAVREAAHVGGLGADPLQRRLDRRHHPVLLAPRRRRDLGARDAAVGRDDHGVGEGTADVDSEKHVLCSYIRAGAFAAGSGDPMVRAARSNDSTFRPAACVRPEWCRGSSLAGAVRGCS